MCARECVSECSSVSVELDPRDSWNLGGSASGICEEVLASAWVSACLCVCVFVSERPSGVCVRVCQSALIHASAAPWWWKLPDLTFSRLSEKFLAGHMRGHLSVPSLPSQSGVYTLSPRPHTPLRGPLHSPPLPSSLFSSLWD